MTKSSFNLERGNKEENEHIPIEKLKKITNYEVQEMFKETAHNEQENQRLKAENSRLKNYIDKTFEYVSLLFDFSKDRLKQLINSFVDSFK